MNFINKTGSKKAQSAVPYTISVPHEMQQARQESPNKSQKLSLMPILIKQFIILSNTYNIFPT